MTELQPNESVLIGVWIERAGCVVADETCRRIDWLIEWRLEHLAKDWSGWETLYKDPRDGRLGERTYPQSEYMAAVPRNFT